MTSKHVPTRLLRANTKHLPWITQAIGRMCKRKQRLFSKAKRSHKSKDWAKYQNAKKETLRTIHRAHWNYINKILLEGLEERDLKPFWRYIKFREQGSVGIAPTKQGGALHTDANTKATLLNQQFKSVFTRRDPNNQVPRLDGPSFPSIWPLVISTMGVQKLLCKLNVKKASGPDNISCKILRELSVEIAPVLTYIFSNLLTLAPFFWIWLRLKSPLSLRKGTDTYPKIIDLYRLPVCHVKFSTTLYVVTSGTILRNITY